MTNPEEKQYIDLIKEILENGSLEEGRNGKTYSIFGPTVNAVLEGNVQGVVVHANK